MQTIKLRRHLILDRTAKEVTLYAQLVQIREVRCGT